MRRVIYFFLLITIVFGCSKRQNSKQYISTTIAPLTYITNYLTDSTIQINTLIPKGMSPESGDFSIETLKKLHDSKACIYFGTLPFEQAQLLPALNSDTSITKIALTDGHLHTHNEQCSHDHNECDPHVWLSIKQMQQISLNIANHLKELYPNNSERVDRNLAKLQAQLTRLDSNITTIIDSKQVKSFVIYHPALSAFAEDYGLEQISIEEHGKEPSPNHIKQIIEQVKEQGISLLLVQAENDATQCKQIANEGNMVIVQFNPLAENYIAEMQKLAETFNTHLK